MPNNELTFHVDEASAPIVRDAFAARRQRHRSRDVRRRRGVGRRWASPASSSPTRCPRRGADCDGPFTFVTDGVERAIRQAKAVADERCAAGPPAW